MGSTKFKIAYFQQDGLITGSAISLRHFLSAIDRTQFEPVVIMAKEGPARNLYEALNIKVEVFYFDTFWTFPGPNCISRGMFEQIKAIRPNKKLRSYILNTIKPDLIHINDKASINIGVSLQGTSIPIVQHSRSSYYITTCNFAKFISKKLINKYANHIICISEDEEDGFENNINKSIIYNTVDFELAENAIAKRSEIRKQLDVKSEEFLIGFAANVTEKKGAWDFLELCKTLKNIENTKFILVGKIEDQGETNLGNGQIINLSPKEFISLFIKENNLEEKLIVTGFREDNLALIASMDLLIVPNKNGVMGRQPIEAQTLGTPVIAQVGHSLKSKIVLNGITGYLVNNINQAITLTKELVLKKTGNDMASNAKKYAEQHFSPKQNMQKIERIYTNLLKN
jgi:glycosyltransferase involved in cell wall biosynthesis